MWLMASQTVGPRDLKIGMHIQLHPGSNLGTRGRILRLQDLKSGFFNSEISKESGLLSEFGVCLSQKLVRYLL